MILLLCGPAFGAPLVVNVADTSGKPVKDAVIYAEPDDAATLTNPEPVGIQSTNSTDVTVDQVDKQFVPHVRVIRTGTAVRFPNKDNIHHHVYSVSSSKHFELQLHKGRTTQPVVFDKPGAVPLGCNIHDWMVGYIYVVDTPYFAKTGDDGAATIDLPAGNYTLRVWHPRLRGAPSEQDLVIAPQGNRADPASCVLKLRPEIKRRRRSRSGGGGY